MDQKKLFDQKNIQKSCDTIPLIENFSSNDKEDLVEVVEVVKVVKDLKVVKVVKVVKGSFLCNIKLVN